MTIISFRFFLLLLISLFLYYLAPQKLQKYVLLTASIIFFVWSSGYMLIIILLYVVLITYIGGLVLGNCIQKRRCIVTVGTILLLLLNLFVLKYFYNIGGLVLHIFQQSADLSWLDFVAPIGISYFTLSAIGYVLDVYWEAYKPERNVIKMALFVCYFPSIVSGPILRYPEMSKVFEEKHSLEYENIAYGMRRMAWGYFKKLVIADRLAIVVSSIYANYTAVSGVIVAIATFCYAFQLYADFSGCMDIILGTSRLYGIKLPENFDAPFFSRSIPEFWRRWHMSLGLWFKDYVMYPILKSELFQMIGKRAKKKLGKRVGKKVPTFLALFLMWFLIGLWHGGTAYYFMASAIIPCILLMGSEFLQPLFEKLTKFFRIRTDCFSWRLFQRIRTFLLMCLCWVFVCAGSVSGGGRILIYMFTSLKFDTLVAMNLATFNLETTSLIILIIGFAAMFIADYFQSQQMSVAKFLDSQNTMFRWSILWGEILMIFFFATLGQSSFIYFKF